MQLSITSLISAGEITEDDNKLLLVNGLSKDQAQSIAHWLAVATNGAVELRHISPLEGGAWRIVSRPEDIPWATADSEMSNGEAND